MYKLRFTLINCGRVLS